jgi:hypothetical protein
LLVINSFAGVFKSFTRSYVFISSTILAVNKNHFLATAGKKVLLDEVQLRQGSRGAALRDHEGKEVESR